MNLDFKKITGYFNKRGASSCDIKPARDWKFMLACFAAILLMVLSADIYIFWHCQNKLQNGPENLSLESDKAIILKKDSLDKIIEEIENKRILFEETKNNPSNISDPSK